MSANREFRRLLFCERRLKEVVKCGHRDRELNSFAVRKPRERSCARLSGTAVGVYATQNISSFKNAFGNGSQEAVKKLFGNLVTWVACRNNHRDTNEAFCDMMGKAKFETRSVNTNTSASESAVITTFTRGFKAAVDAAANPTRSQGISSSEQIQPLIQNADLGRLRTGGEKWNNCWVEALVYFEGHGPGPKIPFYRVQINQRTDVVQTIPSFDNLLLDPVVENTAAMHTTTESLSAAKSAFRANE